ncbi:hypothetical protein L195_g058642 [Trifolium pratense]|uniref:Uncharacterized protein n=1 Tax=Trifolium pratense TaxID=57577 RepID=A0A2K3JTG2_TRIPR|nr:hypothetical protein L195_g058642 [Trifolium pratense]
MQCSRSRAIPAGSQRSVRLGAFPLQVRWERHSYSSRPLQLASQWSRAGRRLLNLIDSSKGTIGFYIFCWRLMIWWIWNKATPGRDVPTRRAIDGVVSAAGHARRDREGIYMPCFLLLSRQREKGEEERER